MFDNVGKNETRSARRDGTAFLLSVATVAGAFLFLFWVTSRVQEVLEEKEEILEVPVSLAAPPPPPPPPGGGQKKPKTEKKKDIIKPKEDVPVEVKPLEEVPVDAPAVESEDEGVAGGVEGGVEGGVVGGVVGGTVGGTGTTLNAPVVKTVYYRDVQWKVRPPQPAFPEGARQMQIEGRCMVHLWIDEEGKPYKHETKNCPTVFEEASVAAALEGRSYPYMVEGKAVPVQFDWIFNFKLK